MIYIAIVIFLLICIVIALAGSGHESFRGRGPHRFYGRGYGWSRPLYMNYPIVEYDPYYLYEQEWARARMAALSRFYRPYQDAELLFK